MGLGLHFCVARRAYKSTNPIPAVGDVLQAIAFKAPQALDEFDVRGEMHGLLFYLHALPYSAKVLRRTSSCRRLA
jgi:hypothetical protein